MHNRVLNGVLVVLALSFFSSVYGQRKGCGTNGGGKAPYMGRALSFVQAFRSL